VVGHGIVLSPPGCGPPETAVGPCRSNPVLYSVDCCLHCSTTRTIRQRRKKLAKYLGTGAAGFIGRSIAAELLKRGESVRGIDNFIAGKRANLVGLDAMEFIEGDLSDPAACARACDGVEVVFHQAALASVPRSVADPIAT